MINPYSVLGILENATDQEIRSAYLRLIQEWPPEKDGARFQEINEAYHAVENEVKRAKLMVFGLKVSENPYDVTMAEYFPTRTVRKRAGVSFWLEQIKSQQKDA